MLNNNSRNKIWLRGMWILGVTTTLFIFMAGCGRLGVQPQIKADVVMTSGSKVRLFHGGTQEAKDLFCVGETVSVYRADAHERSGYVEVGKVKITRPIDEHSMEGVIVEGNVREGDLARKGIAACMVTPLGGGKPAE